VFSTCGGEIHVQMASATAIAEPDRVIIAANPRAGGGSPTSMVGRLADALRGQRLRVDVLTNLDAVTEAAHETHRAGSLRALVAAGGDGTVAELVNRTEPGLPISVFPLGTANLLAGYLGIRADIPLFCQTLVAGRTVQLDAGRANQRIFLLMAGCGFDGEVVERLHRARVGHISMWNYLKPILSAIRSYEYPQLRIECEGAPTGLPPGGGAALIARWAFVVNLPRYAGGLQFAPDAQGSDELLNVCTFERGSLWQGLRYLIHVWTGRQARLPDFGQVLAKRVRIESDRPVRYQLDGDPGGMLPLEIEVLPRRLTLVVPAWRANALGATEAAGQEAAARV
jgi:diacylglycerol kinase family enzyme